MIWLTLRQFRVQAAMVFGGLAVLGAVVALTGPGLADDYNNGLASCGSADNCAKFTRRFFEEHSGFFTVMLAAVAFVPGILGIFWGAPLITRELEHGTQRLVWTQSITRTNWLSVKLGLVGLASMVAAGLAVLAVDWWADPLDKTATGNAMRLAPLVFVGRGVAPIGYAAFALALGVTVGVLLRRTLPAMAVTLVVFIAVQLAVPLWIRPHIIPPETKTVEITADNHGDFMLNRVGDGEMILQVEVEPQQGSWILRNDTVDASGRTVEKISIPGGAGAPCAPPPPGAGGGPP
ncbi:MAG: ABC transporter permease subunit, partial [Actinomycetes bacterium]